MQRFIAVIAGAIVMYAVKAFLGEGKLKTLISIVAGVIVAFVLYFYV